MSPIAISDMIPPVEAPSKSQGKEWKPVPTSRYSNSISNPIRQIVNQIKPNPSQTKKLINLGIGDPSLFGNLPPAPESLKAISKTVTSGKADGYPVSVGYIEARKAIAEYFSESLGGGINENDVYMSHGTSGALEMVFAALAEEGSNVLLPRPLFSAYSTLLLSTKAEVRYYPLMPDKNWEVDLEALDSLVDSNTAFVVINNPSNPCGSNWRRGHVQEIAQWSERTKTLIVSDEVYAGVAWSVPPEPESTTVPEQVYTLPRHEGKFNPGVFTSYGLVCGSNPCLILGSLSKRWLAPGWRCGWVIVKDESQKHVLDDVREAIGRLAFRIQGPASTIQMAIPDIFANTPENFYLDSMKEMESASKNLFDRLETIPGFAGLLPMGAMYLMGRIDLPAFGYNTAREFTAEFMQEENVLMLPGDCFGMTSPAYTEWSEFDKPYGETEGLDYRVENGVKIPIGWVRFVTTTPWQVLSEACSRLEAFCDRHRVSN